MLSDDARAYRRIRGRSGREEKDGDSQLPAHVVNPRETRRIEAFGEIALEYRDDGGRRNAKSEKLQHFLAKLWGVCTPRLDASGFFVRLAGRFGGVFGVMLLKF